MSFKVIEGRKLIYEVIWGYRGSKNPENQIKVSPFTTGMAHFGTIVVGYTMSFHWASDKLSHVWVRLFQKKLKIDTTKDRTLADWTPVYHLTTITTVLMANLIYSYINSTIVIKEILRINKKNNSPPKLIF